MLYPDSPRRLDAYHVALQLIDTCQECCAALRRFNKRLGDQLVESLCSMLQNLSEGLRRTGKDRAHLLTVSLGSCEEARCLLDVCRSFKLLSPERHQVIDAQADRVCAMTYRLRQRSL